MSRTISEKHLLLTNRIAEGKRNNKNRKIRRDVQKHKNYNWLPTTA